MFVIFVEIVRRGQRIYEFQDRRDPCLCIFRLSSPSEGLDPTKESCMPMCPVHDSERVRPQVEYLVKIDS